MKSIILLAVLSITNIANAADHLHRIMPGPDVRVASLYHFLLDESYEVDESSLTGSVSIDLTNRKVNLTVYAGPNCDPGLVCPEVLYEVIKHSVPLIAIAERSDGVVSYIAERDDMPVDGFRVRIHVEDHSLSTNRHLDDPQTRVHLTRTFYDRLQGERVNEVSEFFGGNLTQLIY